MGFEKAHGMPAHLENNNQNQKNHLIVARVFRVIVMGKGKQKGKS
jgi:hypothetical protein